MTESAARKQAKREVAFYRNLASFVLVNAFLVALNLLTSPGTFWAIWPLLGWGIGIVSQAFGVFGNRASGGWQERRVQELMAAETSEARLRELLDESLDERAIPAGAPQDTARLQRRIEHLEAIVTSRDWDEIRRDPPGSAVTPGASAAPRSPAPEAPLAGTPPLADLLDDESPEDAPEVRAARLARRVQ